MAFGRAQGPGAPRRTAGVAPAGRARLDPARDRERLERAGAAGRLVAVAQAGARALARGLAKNPYRRDGLFSLAVAQYQLHDSAALLPTAQRLLALDPLNRTSLKLVAAGWDYRGRRDSTRAYLARADSGLAMEIAMSSFVSDTAGASLGGVAVNLKQTPSTPFRLTVEFLDAAGQVVGATTHDVPAVGPRQSHAFELQARGKGISGWRYRAS